MFAVLFVAFFAFFSMAAAGPIQKRSNTGRGTYYATGLGACGTTNTDSDYIVALSQADYGNGEHCGETLKITANGETHTATVEDKCMGCSSGDLDMSPTLFQTFADESVGVVEVSWYYTS